MFAENQPGPARFLTQKVGHGPFRPLLNVRQKRRQLSSVGGGI